MSILLLDVTEAIKAGEAEYAKAVRAGKRPYANAEQKDRLGDNVIGKVAELIVAKYFDLPYDPYAPDYRGKIDVAGKLEVRGRRVEPKRALPELPYHVDPATEKPQLPYVLVRIFDNHNAEIVGWLYGHECEHRAKAMNLRIDPYWQCWYVPGPYRSLGELRRLLR